jgi:NADP-dependent alcohol dehydrogenase
MGAHNVSNDAYLQDRIAEGVFNYVDRNRSKKVVEHPTNYALASNYMWSWYYGFELLIEQRRTN